MSSTANPRHPNNPPSDYPSESTGAVAKDSLAAESIQSGGGFADNDNAQPLGVRGNQSTLANDDTANAEVLHPASSGAAREAQDVKGLGSDERGQVGVKYPDPEAGQGFEGTHSDQGYRGGSGDASVSGDIKVSGDSGQTTSGGAGAGIRPHVDAAPNYAADFRTEGEMQPKGDNLVEGGDIKSTKKTYTGDVGGPNDPGRLAEQEFAKVTADSSGGTGARDHGTVSGEDNTIYDNLQRSERA